VAEIKTRKGAESPDRVFSEPGGGATSPPEQLLFVETVGNIQMTHNV